MSTRPLAALLFVTLSACVARPSGDTDSFNTEGTGAPSTSSDGNTTADGTTTAVPDPTATTDAPPSQTSTTGPVDPGTTGDTTGGSHDGCDVWTEDCPEGQKCMPWASDGGTSWNEFKCVDVVPDPDGIDEPCTVVDSIFSGEDSCDKHMFCWAVDLDTLTGTCVAMCTGSFDEPGCAAPDATCHVSGASVLSICLPDCDPLAQDCLEGEACIPNPNNFEKFICATDASGDEGQAFDPCEYANACDPGLMCAPAELAGVCDPMSAGCCMPFCDTDLPNTCPGQGLQCLPYHEAGQAPPGMEDLGVCRLPMP